MPNASHIPLPGAQAKYAAVLQLSRRQLAAIDEGDFDTLTSIVAAKGKLIDALPLGGDLAARDPGFAALIAEIRRAERESEDLLCDKLCDTENQLTEIQSRKSAGQAYRSASRKRSFAPPAALPDTPRLFDLHF